MHSCFGIYDKETGCQLTRQLEIHFLELNKFKPGNVKEMNRMERWAAVSSPTTPEKEIAEIVAEDADIRAAVEVEKMFTQDEIARRHYELAEKFRRDQAAQMKYARAKGEESTLLQNIKTLMETMHLTAPQAMDALRVPDSKRGQISAQLG